MSSFIDRAGRNNDDVAFRVESYYLKAASPVFRCMLQTIKSDDQSAHMPDISADTLTLCLKALIGQVFSAPRWVEAKLALRWCKTYDCSSAAKTILHVAVRDLDQSLLFEAFTIAARFDDSSSGQRVLQQGWKKAMVAAKYRIPPGLNVLKNSREWSSAMVKSIPASWLLALLKAEQEATRSHSDHNNEASNAFWATLSALFNKHLHA
ncbi:hypothetical protein EHS25_004069 [Saitozyma podzolica]|uniref:BTB domain-containing protein n=1 Tax=Saitozyma podzolica TaxID=1890683 RepID=A0A427YTA7_9TREE|nr:hypothetical protein EHS25_004069 [Saitozyma podzolica]